MPLIPIPQEMITTERHDSRWQVDEERQYSVEAMKTEERESIQRESQEILGVS